MKRATECVVDEVSAQLCARCAGETGVKPITVHASMEACRFLDMVNSCQSDATIEHMHFEALTRCWVGEEVEGLVAPRNFRPDGVQRGADGRVETCWFYHGCAWHGYPPDHPAHHSFLKSCKQSSVEAYGKTMAAMQCFKARGFQVQYVWSFDFAPFWVSRVEARRRPASELHSIIHTL